MRIIRKKKKKDKELPLKKDYIISKPIQREILYTFFSGDFKIWSENSLAWLGSEAAAVMLSSDEALFINRAVNLKETFKKFYDESGVWIDIDPLGVSLRIDDNGSIYADG